jgi:hypothetical protein
MGTAGEPPGISSAADGKASSRPMAAECKPHAGLMQGFGDCRRRPSEPIITTNAKGLCIGELG